MQADGRFWTGVGGAFRSPSISSAGSAAVLRVAASFLLAVGLFTTSWEQLGNVALGPYNVKFPVVVVSAAAVLSARRWWRWIAHLGSRPAAARWVAAAGGAVVLVFCVRALTSFPLTAGIGQIASIATGAVLPALAVIGVLEVREDVVWALRWFIAGAVLAGVFGLYQLTAFYTGLPQGIVYTGVGTSGSGGRIAAFSYEPAYFAYFLVLAIGAVVALAQLERRRVRFGTLLFFSTVLSLANVRALLFLVPVAAVLLAVEWRRNRVLLGRAFVAALLGSVIAFALPIGATAAVQALHATNAHPATQSPSHASGRPSSHTVSPTRSPEAGASSAAPTAPDAQPAPPQLPTDVLDPDEVSSNGPRLDLYRAVLAVVVAHPLFGVGPGHLRDALAEDGFVASNQGANVVANNIWLQAAADGGLVLVLLEAALVAAVAVLWWRRRRAPEQALLSVWLAVVLVGGMLTSYLFDIKVWVVLALAVVLATARADARTGQPETAEA